MSEITIDAEILKDGETLVTVYSGYEEANHGVNTALVECNMFQSVWVECQTYAGSIPGSKRSSFSGVLLTEYA